MQENTQNNNSLQRERAALKTLVGVEDIAEKKTRIFSRLLMDATLAQDMEKLAKRHEERKQTLLGLLGEKSKKKSSGEETQS